MANRFLRFRKLTCTALSLSLFGISYQVRAQVAQPLLLRHPSLSRTQIVFSYAGYLWIGQRNGGSARQLTNGGHESNPAFSPDGAQIAFNGSYNGTAAVYIVPMSGGTPRRLTFHAADEAVVGWSPDGKSVLFRSARSAFGSQDSQPIEQLFTVSAHGGFATPIPLFRAADGSFSPDGSHIAYVPFTPWTPGWKHYRGGQTRPIWIANLADSNVELRIPRENSNDFNPMWVGDFVYFLSDRNGPVTIFSYNTKTKSVTQVVQNNGLDIKSASAGPDAIIYEQFGSLHLLDLKSKQDRELRFELAADIPEVRPHFQKIDPRLIQSANISPNGARAVVSARGEIFTIPAEKGDVRDITNTVDVVERDPAWSPDGKSIAYFSDESGEYALHVRDQSGEGRVRKIDLGQPSSFYYSPVWAPDSKKIAYTDKRLNVWYVDLNRGIPIRVDADTFAGRYTILNPAWSPDGEWLVYSKQLGSHLHALFAYSLKKAARYQLTDGTADAISPAFDKNGKYLYFLASTDAGLSLGWPDMSILAHTPTRTPYVMLLNRDTPSPLGLVSDEENAQQGPDKKQTSSETIPPPNITKSESESKSTIDIEAISNRIEPLPVPARNYRNLIPGKSGIVFLIEGPAVDSVGSGEPRTYSIYRFDLNGRKADQILSGITPNSYSPFETRVNFAVSATGEKLLYARQNQWFIAPADGARDNGPAPLTMDEMEAHVDPRAEWRHMYYQVWRNEREFFYDPGLHGLNLPEVSKKYEPYLNNLSSRDDLNYLFEEMLGNLVIGHIFIGGPDFLQPDKGPRTGLLGADYKIENGRYRFTRIYRGDIWNPQLKAPLAQAEPQISEGDYLLAVNGRDVTASEDIYSFFQQTAGKQTRIEVAPSPDGRGSREITIVPIDDETSLRNFAWIEENRHKVDEMTGGRVAYVYLPDTAGDGYKNFNRFYFAQVGKDAAIIDERYNGGGYDSDYIIDHLQRKVLGYWSMREGKDITIPIEAIFGPKVLIMNEMAGSGGDVLASIFRQAHLGRIVGKRTWGGGVGFYTNPMDLLDGSFVATPDLAFYGPDGKWDIENYGVPPDIEVDDDPRAARAGQDPQLEEAVKTVMQELRQTPPSLHPRPLYPNYYKGAAH